ncbi:hypothetical protein PMAYCL1PPCAC_09089, partial [Pristionchus mayeri]
MGNSTYPTYLQYDIADIDEYAVMVFWDSDIFGGIHWRDFLGCTYLAISVEAVYIFIVYASYNIVCCLRKNSALLSEGNHRQHTQLFRALSLQPLRRCIQHTHC